VKYLFILCFVFTTTAFAKLYGEPYIGFSSGGGESKYSSATYEHEYSGRLYGFRAGYVASSKTFYSLDYSLNRFILDSEESGAVADDEVSRSQLGINIGRAFSGFKLWGTLFLFGEISGEDSQGSNQFISNQDSIDDLQGFGLGVSFFIFKRTQLCIELRNLSYGGASSGSGSVAGFDSTSLSEYVVSLSFPFGGGK
jgi:hypothetical protein